MQVLAQIRHPHTELCHLEGPALPLLVMEQLDSSLDNLLETSLCLTLKHPMASLRRSLGHIMAGKTGPGPGPGPGKL